MEFDRAAISEAPQLEPFGYETHMVGGSERPGLEVVGADDRVGATHPLAAICATIQR